ncbi:hypothetical protein Pcinc_008103 [Petrolisthes cinctipes]|uniref:Uncharacterized protein n=1 Tax=Petrolisthes cinctipes TaxID=88211 RepID=A0AAE1G9P2_PETCI|nr:hypothetical protein Pcinc_008103 [Petrolisthes cinctipes]
MPLLLSNKRTTTRLHCHSTLAPPTTPHHAISRATLRHTSTARYDTHTLPTRPPRPSHRTTMHLLSCRSRITNTTTMLAPPKPSSLHHSDASIDTTLPGPPHHCAPSQHTHTPASLCYSKRL